MKPTHENCWEPSPQLLAAYADGELEGTRAFDNLRQEIEQWLIKHPQEARELDYQRELSRLMAESRPSEPPPAVWASVWARALKSRPFTLKRPILRCLVGMTAAAALAMIVFGNGLFESRTSLTNVTENQQAKLSQFEPEADGLENLELVRAEDIEIIHVSGPDMGTLVIGRAPLAEAMTILQLHEMTFCPSANAEPKTELRSCGNRTPLVWTPLPSECKGGR